MDKTLSISNRGYNAPTSPIRDLVPLAETVKRRGVKVYHLNIGDPDFQLPMPMQQSLKNIAKNTKYLPYPSFRGQKELLNAWKSYYHSIGIPFEFLNEEMIVTAGASDAMVLIAATITDPGDEIIVFEPFYGPYQAYAVFISAKFVPIALDPKRNYHLPSKEEIVSKISSKTKAIFFTNPNNPTGTVFTREEMKTILDIAYEYKLFVVCDETYRDMVFDGRESLSMFAIANERNLNNIIVSDSLSKRFNVCGARMGLIASKNKEFMDAAFRFVLGRPFASLLEQEIVTPMLYDCTEYINWLRNQYQKRRDVVINTLKSQLDIPILSPEGAFYVMVQLPIRNTIDFTKWLLTDFQHNNATVMIAPGSGFYQTETKGKNEIRIAYVLQEKELQSATELLSIAVKQYLTTKE